MGKTIYLSEYRKMIELLKKARIDAGLSQLDVAKKIKKPQSYISKCESSERRLDIIELKKFAVIYNKNISYFLR